MACRQQSTRELSEFFTRTAFRGAWRLVPDLCALVMFQKRTRRVRNAELLYKELVGAAPAFHQEECAACWRSLRHLKCLDSGLNQHSCHKLKRRSIRGAWNAYKTPNTMWTKERFWISADREHFLCSTCKFIACTSGGQFSHHICAGVVFWNVPTERTED